MSPNYDTTKYEEKRTHGAEPEPGTRAFGEQAAARLARLQEQAINQRRPQAVDEDSAMGKVQKHRTDTEDILRQAGE